MSDAHLGVGSPWDGGERALRQFLGGITDGSLVINGDLFDFWFEWRTVIPRSSYRVLAALADLRERGVPVLWIAGNHDCWGGEILRNDVGVDYHVGPWSGSLAGWSARVEHGDGLRKVEDRRYRVLRGVIRHPTAVRAYRWLPADIATWLATRSSHASRTYSARDGGAGLRAVAERTLTADPRLELMVLAHSHVATIERMKGGGIYANAGAWISGPKEPGPTFLMVTPDKISLNAWISAPAETLPTDQSSGARSAPASTRRGAAASGHAQRLNALDRVSGTEEPAGGTEELLRGIRGDEPIGR
jgi:UDP-2,3-diacylglucosamine hydrolase